MKNKILNIALCMAMVLVWLSVAVAVYATLIGNHNAGVSACMVGITSAVIACLIECVIPRQYDLG